MTTSKPALEGVDLTDLPELLRQTLGRRARVVSLEQGNWRRDYAVLLVTLEEPALRVVVKLAGREAELACPFERTARLHELVRSRTHIPMPEILGVDTSYARYPWRYLVKAHIEGMEWVEAREQMDEAGLADAFGQIGQAVAELHAMRFPAFGELTVSGTVEQGMGCFEAVQARSREWIQPPVMRGRFLELLESRRGLFEGVKAASLCHEDLHQHNLLFERREHGWRLATILDFDKAWAGHGESDLARLALWRGMSHPELWSAYHTVHAPEPGWEERRPIYQLLWCLEYARETPQHLADTARLCQRLGVRFEGFE